MALSDDVYVLMVIDVLGPVRKSVLASWHQQIIGRCLAHVHGKSGLRFCIRICPPEEAAHALRERAARITTDILAMESPEFIIYFWQMAAKAIDIEI